MNYLKQLAILLACCVAGDALSILMHGALPGNVLGLALLLLLLVFGRIQPHQVEGTAVCVLTTLCTAAATALTVHLVCRLQRRAGREVPEHE